MPDERDPQEAWKRVIAHPLYRVATSKWLSVTLLAAFVVSAAWAIWTQQWLALVVVALGVLLGWGVEIDNRVIGRTDPQVQPCGERGPERRGQPVRCLRDFDHEGHHAGKARVWDRPTVWSKGTHP